MKCGYSIKKPGKDRRTFAVHWKIYDGGAKPKQPLVKDERIDAINSNFRSGILSYDEALLQLRSAVEQIRAELSAGDEVVKASQISEKNLKLYHAFMKDHYRGREIKRPHTIRNEFNFALLAIEPLSIISSSKAHLQDRVDEVFNDKQSRRYVGRINQLLVFANRDFKLHAKKRKHAKVRYVTLEELNTILAFVQDYDLKNLYTTLFCTGVRFGEAFTLKERDIKPNGTIYIQEQMTEKLEIREIKNSKPHHTIVLPEGMKAVKAWSALPHSKKESLRTRGQHPLTNAAKKAFQDKGRWISPHDLRHSYAIHMLGLGVPLDKVAKLIGDSLKTTEEYYAAFTMSENEVEFVQKIIKSG